MSFLLRIEEKKIKIHEITTIETKQNKTKLDMEYTIQNKRNKKKHLVKQVISREFLNLETDLF